MVTSEKSKLVAASLVKAMEQCTKQFRKSRKRRIQSIAEKMNLEEVKGIVSEAVIEYTLSMNEWEDTALEELDGMTPRQYFETLNNLHDMMEMFTLMEEKNGGVLPAGLTEKLKSLGEGITDDVFSIIDTMVLGENKCLNYTQKAAVHIAAALKNPDFTAPLIKIAAQLDDEKSDEESINTVLDAVREMGEPVLEPLMELAVVKRKGRVYSQLVLIIGEIGSLHKSERIYRLLKDLFRESDEKYVEANALASYGDGRAIPAIRGYVERHHEEISYIEYLYYKEAVLALGGDMHDIDDYFSNYYDDYEDFDELDEDDENN